MAEPADIFLAGSEATRLLGVRLSAAIGLLLLALYCVLRIAASQCSGAPCDWYIPFSLLIPIAVLVMVLAAGYLAFLAAWRVRARGWAVTLTATTAIAVAGPPLALSAFRDSPDVLVPVAIVLWLVGLGAVLAYSFLGQHPRAPG